MREIKFRAWHRVPEGEWDEAADDWKYQMNYTIAFEEYEPINDLLNQVENLMQFTGLKDKNGQDSYHKDIVKYVDDSGTPQVGIIIWDERAAGFHIEAIGGDDEGNQDGDMVDRVFEIIGNIWENPELLNNYK